MTSLEDLKVEQQQLIRHIKAMEDGGPTASVDPLVVESASARLALVNRQIAEREGPVDHGGWEDS